MYPLVFFDALRVKIRDKGLVRNKAVYVALGVTPEGTKDNILGLWIETSEGAKFWVARHDRTQEPRRRGHSDCRRRWPEGISRGYRRRVSADDRADLHRSSQIPQFQMDFASHGKTAKPIAAELKAIYRGDGHRRGPPGAGGFRRRRSGAASIRQSRRAGGTTGALVIPFFALSTSLCGASFSTTNAIRSLNAQTAARRANERPFSNR